MTIKRESFWNAASREQYTATSMQLAQKTIARKNGEPTAQMLEATWPDLSSEEKLFIEYLCLSDKRTVVALYEDELFTELMSKGLLRTPPGVGTIFMRHLQTTFSIPFAVWSLLREKPELFYGRNENDKDQRIDSLTQHFNDRVDTLLIGPDPD